MWCHCRGKSASKADAPKAEQTARDCSTLSNTMNYLRKTSEILLRAINVALRPLVNNRIDVTNGSVVTHNLKCFIFKEKVAETVIM